MSRDEGPRLFVWADTWPSVYPPTATLEAAPWATPPAVVASRAAGLAADAIVVVPPPAPAQAVTARLQELRRCTRLPLWWPQDAAGPAPDGPVRASVAPFEILPMLEPASVDAALARARTGPPGDRAAAEDLPLVAMFGPCGGVGTSTLAVALARTLAMWSVPTVLTDLNLHAPDLTAMLGAWRDVDGRARLETYLREPRTSPVPIDPRRPLALVPGLADLENLDDVSVGAVVALFERLRDRLRVVDTAPVVTDPAVYATLRSASHLVVVIGTDVSARLQLRRYHRLFAQLGLRWREALLVVNHSRPGPLLSAAQVEEEVGLAPVSLLPYRSGLWAKPGALRLDAAWKRGVEALAATVIGRSAGAPSPGSPGGSR